MPDMFMQPSDFALSAAWLREHQHRYRGFWVALRGGVLVDCDPSRKALDDRLTRAGEAPGVLVVKIGLDSAP